LVSTGRQVWRITSHQATMGRITGNSFHKIIQRIFQHFECFFQAQHQRGHLLPVQIKGMGVAEHMAETQAICANPRPSLERSLSFFEKLCRIFQGAVV
jgi:hypothetical protein